MHIQVQDTHSTGSTDPVQSAPVQVSQEFKPAQHDSIAPAPSTSLSRRKAQESAARDFNADEAMAIQDKVGLWASGGVESLELYHQRYQRDQLPLQVTALNEQLSRLKASGLADVELLRFHAGVVKGVS